MNNYSKQASLPQTDSNISIEINNLETEIEKLGEVLSILDKCTGDFRKLESVCIGADPAEDPSKSNGSNIRARIKSLMYRVKYMRYTVESISNTLDF
jgi:hypothetical protein